MKEANYHYYAFISYNHRDEKIAKWLQTRLEHYKLPSVARKEIGEDVKIRPVFRYVSDLGVAVLREKIKEELEASKYLIVICSPHSARPNVKGEHWVNDEVKRFISLGRKDRIIPVIVDGVPGDGKRECFCPALGEMEIAGVDFQKEEKSICIQKIVAKLLGLRPDILIQRYLEGQKKKRRLWLLGLLPFFALTMAVGLFAWDMSRSVSLYFADYVDCYGLPEGIYEVPKSDLRVRSSTYRFDYKGYYWHGVHLESLPRGWFGFRRKLERVVHVGPTDVPADFDDFEWVKTRPVIMTFVYDDANRMMTKVVRKRGGNDFASGSVVKLIHYSCRTEAGKTVVNGHMEETFEDGVTPYYMRDGMAQTTDKDGVQESNPTRIACANIGRDAFGRMISIRFLDADKEFVSDADGVAGHEFVLTERHGEYPGGAIKEIHHIGEDGKRHANKYGVATTRYEREGPYVTVAENQDASSVPVIGNDGYFRTIVSYDINGNPITQVMKNRYYSTAYRVSRNGIEDDFIPSMSEWASSSREYYDGLLSELRFYRPDGKLVDRRGCAAIVKASYNHIGDLIDVEFFDSNTNRMVAKEGFSRIRIEPDPVTGEVLTSEFLDEHDKPAYASGDLVNRKETLYDVNTGKEKEVRFFDESGNLMIGGSCYAIARFDYDGQGRLTGMSSYDTMTNSCVIKEFGGNVGRVTIKYKGKTGKEVRHEYWTDDSCTTRACAENGHYGILCRFDDSGRISEEWYLDENGQVPQSRKSTGLFDKIAKMTGANAEIEIVGFKYGYRRLDSRVEIVPRRFAEKGFREKTTTFYADEETTKYSNGYCTTRDITDMHGNIVFRIFENDKGERVECEDAGYAVEASDYDDIGQHIGSFYYDKDGNTTIDKNTGVSGEKVSYEDVPYKTETTTYLSVDHRTSSFPTCEVFSVVKAVDKGDGVIERSYWHEGKAVRCANGYHLERVKRNVFGLDEEQSFFDEHGNPCKSTEQGFSHAVVEYNAFRQNVRAYRYDEKGALCHIDGQTFCVKEWDYDSKHRETEVRFIGQEIQKGQLPKYSESPAQDESGISRVTKSYHGNTRIIARLDEFGLRNVPCLYGNTDVWHRVTCYDIYGRMTNECFYSVSDSSIDCNAKYAEGRFKYDLNGNIISAVEVSADGNVVVSIGGNGFVDGTEVSAEKEGCPNEELCFDLSPSVVATQQIFHGLDLSGVGSVRVKMKTALSGSFIVVDANQRQMLIPNGFSRCTVEKRDNGNFRRLDYYALPGEGGVWGSPGVHHEVRLFDEKGQMTNECYFAVSGAPTTNEYGMVRREIRYDVDGERTAIYGYDCANNRFSAKMFVGVNDVLPETPADKVGMRKGDVICAFSYGTNSVDFTSGALSNSTFAQWQKTIVAAKDVEKSIVFAKKQGDDFAIEARTFPEGQVGFFCGPHLIFENDYTKLQDALKRHVKRVQAEHGREVRNEQTR